jgi:hypothetical protein
MQPGDRVIWLRSPGRSFLTGWRVQAVPGIVVRTCKYRLRIRVHLNGEERVVSVDPENVLTLEETRTNSESCRCSSHSSTRWDRSS